MTRRLILAAVAAVAAAAVTVADVTPAVAASPGAPATRHQVANIIVERGLLADVTPRDRSNLWLGSECAADLEALTYYRRRKICYVMALGFMGDTGRSSAYPTFEPHATITRAQMATVVQRLATQESVRMPAHAAVFIDVKRNSTHEPAIRWGAYHGILRGYPTTPATYRPGAPVTVRQARNLVDRVVNHWRTGSAG